MKPYGVMSDTHCHNFSAFASTDEHGINSRLNDTLKEFERCAKIVAEMGGNRIYHAGDLFHVRGSIAPSVINPTRDMFEHIHCMYGVSFTIMAGNHDLEHKEASQLGNAVEAVRCGYVEVVSEMTDCVVGGTDEDDREYIWMVPWHDKVANLKTSIDNIKTAISYKADAVTLMLHAPVDGVIPGLPDHGLTADYLAGLGFKRVFVGHYHNHKDFGNGIYSIGALTHQTWGDVGSKAGFLTVSDEGVKWHCTHAPQFVSLNGTEDPIEAELKVDGNYVRVKLESADMKQIKEIQDWLTKCGARGHRIDVVKAPTKGRREGATVKAGASVETSIAEFIKASEFADAERVTAEALKTYAEAA